MKIGTFSIVAGTAVCNARCDFCVSKMTPPAGVEVALPEVNWRNFAKACRLAAAHNVTTILITGKGEPTLYPERITEYLEHIDSDPGFRAAFPIIELQTNAIPFGQRWSRYESHLRRWYDLGLTTIAISVVSHDPELNRQTYLPHLDSYPDLPATLARLHEIGFSTRLSVVMTRDVCDSVPAVLSLVDFARAHQVTQLTFRPVARPSRSQDEGAYHATGARMLSADSLRSIANYFELNAQKLMTLPHDAVVFDLDGQNVCLTDCLSIRPETDDLRQLIFFPDGHLRYDWQYEGAVLI